MTREQTPPDQAEPIIEWISLRGMEDAKLGKLLRALGKTGAIYRETERAAHCPSDTISRERGSEAYHQEYVKFRSHLDKVDAYIGQVLTGAIQYANIESKRIAMYYHTAIFSDGEPVLYWEHWGTDDLDDPGRDPFEFQRFIGLGGSLQTDAGKKIAHSVLSSVLEDGYATISPSEVPNNAQTFGTAPPELFAPFVSKTDGRI